MLETILNKCVKRQELTRDEILYLLTRKEDRQIQQIYQAARQERERVFGNKVFLYGFVYFSTYCKNNCTFCYYRKDNECPPRYRKSLEQVVRTASELKDSGVHLIDLTTGDDPYYTEHPERLAEIVKAVKTATDLPVMVSPGLLNEKGLQLVHEAGADWYALYQETHRKSLFVKLRAGQSYEARMKAKQYAAGLGILIEEGLLTGVGDTPGDKANSFQAMKKMKASQVRTMTFIPQEGAPLQGDGSQGYGSELLNIAVMRLLFPDALIPASLDVEGLEGLKTRLMAGANVVTSIIPPEEGYAGVANSSQDIDEGYRTVEGIQETLRECDMENASAEEYRRWVEERRHHIGSENWKSQLCG